MNVSTREIVAAGLAIGVAVAAVYFGFGSRAPKIDLDPYAVLGTVTAEETAKLLGQKGKVLVMVRDTGPEKNPSVEAELAAFYRALKPHGGMTPVTQRVQGTPMQMMATGGGVPPDQLFQALDANGNVAGLVLFCSLPPLDASGLEALKKRALKVVVVSAFHPGYQQLLQQQVIHLAIAPRTDGAPPEGAPARTVREKFERDFVLITASGPIAKP